ncbi:MAG TPA: glutamine--fructose-6-phosphate transaminase (isomerizing) [Chloroflexota bacterium]|nr:glutamine--fructose-6-phosphate transaminase (isomerizing) [Chloroflexota bacterium]
MCGIIGYIGDREAVPVIVRGLRGLEYRGYDSAGVAVVHDGEIPVRRSVGKLDQLEAVLAREPLAGHLGVGHTRWATHGRVTSLNAHPQSDCNHELVVIHNGIIENFVELKDELLAAGHTFVSQTDTEVIAHLVEAELGTTNLVEACRRAFLRLDGHNAILVISRRYPDQLIAARLGNAGGIVLGFGEGEMFVASDRLPIMEYTRTLAFLGNRELAQVDRNGAQIFRLDGSSITRDPEVFMWDPVAAAKGGYKHYMLKEINEQPDALTDTIRGRVDFETGRAYLDELNLTESAIAAIRRVSLVGCGTAWHAALIGKFLLEALAKLPAEVEYGSEFRYREPLLGRDTAVLAITQSGETADTIAPMEQALEQGLRTLVITNTPGSRAAQIADGVLYTQCGPEIGVASTKCFTTQLAALAMLGLFLGERRGVLDAAAAHRMVDALARLPEQVAEVLGRAAEYELLAGLYFKKHDFLFLGRGINYPVALEGALKLKEISYIHAEGYPAGEMKHGPISLIDENMPVVAVATQGHVYEKMISQIEQVKARDGIAIVVANDGDTRLAGLADHVLCVPRTDPLLQPILNTVPLQLLAYGIALRRGCDVDQPRNLAKSVTVE